MTKVQKSSKPTPSKATGAASSKPTKQSRSKRSGKAAKQSNNSTFNKLESPLKPLAKGKQYQPGSYGGARAKVTTPKGQPSNTTPSGAAIEVDHMTPKSLHTSKKMSQGQLDNMQPAAGLNVTQHRRKLTTGSGPEVEHHRDYLQAAHHGHVPFAGPMNDRQDHYAAAMQIDIAGTSTASTLFNKPTMHDPRVSTAPTHQGDVPIGDARQGLTNQKTMVDYAHGQGLINEEGKDRMHGLLNETDNNLPGLYQEHGKRTG